MRGGIASGRDRHLLFVRLPASYAASGGGVEYILVGIDGMTSSGGSFWADSPVSGYWERMVIEEILPFVESRFRCVGDRSGRALAGFSMGGFAAWKIALERADLFTAFWAACPGAMEGNGEGVRDAMASWDLSFRNAFGAAFAPDTSLSAPFARIPTLDGSASDAELIRLWEGGFGQADEKIARYLAGSGRLTGARFEYAENDSYGWIKNGTAALETRMKGAGIPSEIQHWQAGHTIRAEMVSGGFVPFFSRMFEN